MCLYSASTSICIEVPNPNSNCVASLIFSCLSPLNPGIPKSLKFCFSSNPDLYKSIFTYGLNGHRHYIEIKQELESISKNKIKLTFNPQVIPTFRGILTSIYIESGKNLSSIKIINTLKKYYKKMKFVKINKLNQPINSGNVINTNNCEISVCEDKISKKIVIFSVIDNLIKGASGQATQNMNMMFGLSESKGLK